MEKQDLRLHRGAAALLGALGSADARVVEVHGDGTWHSHVGAEELAVVMAGRMDVEFRDRPAITLETGEALLIPRGVEHRARAAEPCALLLVRERDPA
jgi:quercetin dioxygenase-like cupin family protein